LTDWLFLVGLGLGLAEIVRTIVELDQLGASATAFNLLRAVPVGLLVAGIVGGSVREYRRGRGIAAET
jgi:hypothetical protein